MPRLPTKRWKKKAYTESLYTELGKLEAEKRFYRKNPLLFLIKQLKGIDIPFTVSWIGLTYLVHNTILTTTEFLDKANRILQVSPIYPIAILTYYQWIQEPEKFEQWLKETFKEKADFKHDIMLWLLSAAIAYILLKNIGKIFQTVGDITAKLPSLVGAFLG